MKGIKGKVIAIASGKGGVGKTIFATNLAGVYHHLKKKTLLIDMDLSSGGINVLLNLSNAKTIYNHEKESDFIKSINATFFHRLFF